MVYCENLQNPVRPDKVARRFKSVKPLLFCKGVIYDVFFYKIVSL